VRISFGKRAAIGVATTIALVLAATALLWRVADWDAPKLVRVAAVVDGDTCRFAGGARVRLAGVDAPELAHYGQPAQYYAAESKAAFARLVRDVPVRFVAVGPGRDRFDRLLGELLLPDGTSVGERLAAEGEVFCFWFSDVPKELADRMLVAQRRAMAAGKGFWPRLLSLPAPPAPYVGNAVSRRFHAPDCPDGKRISRRNRTPLPTLADAFARGFSPARDCTPWPKVR